ncbi:MAG: UDP-N-acetylmuramoyl-tripeptide--D-alanyl-D-alanine ligase [Thermotogaceae bacterium]|nr:UDP-N-acetylmuramoyl-tripeptide--D-alanyl-D-alanine ligase [Thermotogaceae bacterium]
MKKLLSRRFVLDSRSIRPGDVFVAIKGKKVDGHEFVREAFERGAYAAVVEKPVKHSGNIYLVENVVDFLADLAREKLGSLESKRIIGITGSNGKTTTKEILYQLLSFTDSVFKTPGNMNTEYGLPLSLINEYKNENILVLEMAMNKKGDIKHLCSIAPPDIAVILNVGTSHIGLLGSRKDIMEAKLEIISYSRENSVVVCFHDDDELRERVREINKKTLFFGRRGGDVVLEDWWYANGDTACIIEHFGEKIAFKLSGIWNEGQILSLLASVSVLKALGKELPVRILPELKLPENRFHVMRSKGLYIINDTYNASLESFDVAVKTMLRIGEGKKYAVVGSIKEQGMFSKETHERLGKKLEALDGVYLYTADDEINQMKCSKILMRSDNPKVIAKNLFSRVAAGDVILFKASRFVEIEKVLKEFMGLLGK